LDDIEELDNGSWCKSWVSWSSLDSESLSRTGLTIGKDTNIVSIYCTLNESLAVFEHILLSAFRTKDRIEVVILETISRTNGD